MAEKMTLEQVRNERDELRRQLSELRESTHYANGVADLAMKHRDAAESRLAAADALLRDMRDGAFNIGGWADAIDEYFDGERT